MAIVRESNARRMSRAVMVLPPLALGLALLLDVVGIALGSTRYGHTAYYLAAGGAVALLLATFQTLFDEWQLPPGTRLRVLGQLVGLGHVVAAVLALWLIAARGEAGPVGAGIMVLELIVVVATSAASALGVEWLARLHATPPHPSRAVFAPRRGRQ